MEGPVEQAPNAVGPRRAAAQRRRRRSGLMLVLGVVGDLLVTAGVFVLLFMGWQLFLNNDIVGGEHQAEANALGQSWAAAPAPGIGKQVGSVPKPGQAPSASIAVYQGQPKHGEVFANLIIPKFGPAWQRIIAEGTDARVLSQNGIGHYPASALPGQEGNFAIASHRDIDGAAFQDIDLLDVGDSMYIQTSDGWYRYVFRSHTVVRPSAADAVAPVPFAAGAAPDGHYLTLTTCTPKWTSTERLIVYGVLDAFIPAADGPPAEIAGLYVNGGGA